MILFKELKRRNVFRVAIAYVITSWLLAQVLEIVLDSFGSPDWVMKTVLVMLAAGLPLALILAWAFEVTPEGIKKEKDVDRSQSITGKTGRKLNFTIIGILAVAVVFLLYDRFSQKGSEPFSLTSAEVEVTSAAEKRALTPFEEEVETTTKSIAVLPFVNMSSDPEQDYFSDGISEEILNALARVKELKVAGRTSSFAFKGKDQDLRVIGETLGVGHILEGSVRKSGNTVRITAQLIQVEDGFHLWSDTYDRELDNVFAIQDEIATAILVQLKATLIAGNLALMEADRTNSKAYELYLLAKQRMYERRELPLQSALALLDEAIVLDPNYAPAHAQRAITTLLLRDEMYGSIPKVQAMAQAKLYIDKALALDPDLAEANAALGLYHISRPQESALAVEPLQKALAINPNMVNAANWLSTALGDLGRVQEAIALYEDMTKRDPFYRPGIHGAVGLFNSTGRTDQSWALIDRISPFFPEDPMLSRLKGMTFMSEGRPGDAIPQLESAKEREPSSLANRISLGFALILSGQYGRAAEIEIPRVKAFALFMLDRAEEANIITAKLAASGENVSDHINYMVMSGKYSEAINFFETRWPSFDAFEVDFPPIGSGAVITYGDLAHAYASVGNEERFQESMLRFRTHLDRLKELGFEFVGIQIMEAVYFTLVGDHASALKNLNLAIDGGWLGFPRMSKEWVQLKPLEGDPEYEAIQARMVKHMNEERAKVNLGPMSI